MKIKIVCLLVALTVLETLSAPIVSAGPAYKPLISSPSSGRAKADTDTPLDRDITALARTYAFPSLEPTNLAEASVNSKDLLKKYPDAAALLKNPMVVREMKKVMGTKYFQFKDCTQLMTDPQVAGDQIFILGGIEGLFSINESVLVVNTKTEQVQVALLNDNYLNIWGAPNLQSLYKSMGNYVKNVLVRTHDRPPKLKFDAPNKSSIPYLS